MSIIQFKSSPFYRGNKNLHKVGVPQNFTLDQVKEIKKCRDDINYFASKYFYIVHIDHGKIIIPLTDYQKELLNSIQENRFSIILQSRQSFKTTTLTIAILHYILFNEDKEVALLGNKEKQSKGVLERIKLAYELLPMWLKHGVRYWNKKNIELANGSSIQAAATSSASIRGDSIAFLLIDEAAFIDNWEEFYTSTYPTIASGRESRIVLVSTANGMNHFYKMWEDARRAERTGDKSISEFVCFEVNWRDVPGRDEDWKRQTIANTSEEAFLQEHDNIFLGSSNTLVSISALHSMVFKDPIFEKDGLKIFKRPEKGHTYVASVDTARGSKNDYSAISVVDVTQYPFEQVATYRNNEISYVVYPDVVYRIVKEYNDAWCIVENNDIGGHVVHELNDTFEYDNLVNDSKVKYELGVRTTTRTKNTGCSNLKDLAENKKLIINDFDTIAELSTFEERGKSYQASRGHNDDMAMTLVLFSWFTSTQTFEDISNKNYKNDVFKKQIDNIYESLLPEPMIVNGVDDGPEYVSEGGEFWELGDSDW
jgi:hypothetical protein